MQKAENNHFIEKRATNIFHEDVSYTYKKCMYKSKHHLHELKEHEIN